MQRIIYTDTAGTLRILVPASEALEFMSLDEIAEKDVPTGVPYKIVDAALVPEDRTFRDAWEADTVTDADGVGA